MQQLIYHRIRQSDVIMPDVDDYLDSLGIDYMGQQEIFAAENVVIWWGINHKYGRAILDLITSGKVKLYVTDPLPYLSFSRILPAMPLARTTHLEQYRRMHWLPVVLSVR